MAPHLVLIETSGNQAFIFATNKLRENVGASQMIWRAGFDLVPKSIKLELDESEDLGKQLLRFNRDSAGIKLLTIASGKALLLVESAEEARRIVCGVTKAALKELPGVDVRGAVSACNREGSADGRALDADVRRVHSRFAHLRALIPGPESRFPRLPPIADCATSRYPASGFDERELEFARRDVPDRDRFDPALVSASSRAKRCNFDKGINRLLRPADAIDIKLPRTVADMEKLFGRSTSATDGNQVRRLEWLAVIHADGNGVGQIFQRFAEHAQATDWRGLDDRMVAFSLGLDACGERAFQKALISTQQRWDYEIMPVVPLVLGGDDLTVLCDGKIALGFAYDYLRAFEAETEACADVADIAGRAFGGERRLSASAGIAIVKPHFPFHLAYELAESLGKSAKAVKKKVRKNCRPFPCSALDFHVHYDASGADLDRIRGEHLTLPDGERLYARPYVVTDTGRLETADDRKWAEAHHFRRLKSGLERLNPSDPDERIPRTILHELREALFLGRTGAEDVLTMVQKRRSDDRLDQLLTALGHSSGAGGVELFRQASDETGYESALLDALDVVEFWR